MSKNIKYSLFFGVVALGIFLLSRRSPQSETQETPTKSISAPAHTQPKLETSTSAPLTGKTIPALLPQQSIPLPRKKNFDKPYAYFKNRLQLLESCFEKPCKLPNSDAKSYEYAVFMEIEKTLETLKTWQQRHDFKDVRITQLMTQFLAYEKSEIKVMALDILSTQLKDERVVPHVLKHVISQAFPAPISPGIKELTRYKNGKWKNEIEDTLLDVLTHGSIYSAVEVAKNIKPIMDSNNKKKFSEALEQLSAQPLSRDIYAALKTSLDN